MVAFLDRSTRPSATNGIPLSPDGPPASARSGGLTEDQVIEGYRLFLGRKPETRAVVENHRENYADQNVFWRDLVECEEFTQIRDRGVHWRELVLTPIIEQFWRGSPEIAHDVSPASMKRLVARVRDQWVKLGEEDPHWSVLTADVYRADNLDSANLLKFRESGAGEAALIDLFEARTGRTASRGVCLELGAGVGRLTRFLAGRFDHVIAVDISPGNLKLCDDYMTEMAIANVSTERIQSVDDLAELPDFDFFFSLIVLQHNSPPIQKALLRTLLRKIRPGGGALFQIPTDIVGYTFDVSSYLRSPDVDMEIHSLPKFVVLDEIRDAGLDLIDVTPDAFIGLYGSNTFYAIKPSSASADQGDDR